MMKENLFWEERKVGFTINDAHIEFYKSLHPKQIVVDKTDLPLHVFKVHYKVTTIRGKEEQQEKIVLTSSPNCPKEILPLALMQWHEEMKANNQHRAYKHIEYIGYENMLNQLELASITIEQGEELSLERLTFKSKIFSLFKLAFQDFSRDVLDAHKDLVQFRELEEILGDIHSKQVICYELSMKFSIEEITFTYSKNNKKRTATKSFVVSQETNKGSLYLDKHQSLERISRWMNNTGKKFSNVKILENKITSNVGVIAIQ